MAHDKSHVHIVPIGVLIATWVALLVLTFATVAIARVELGQLNIVAALGIAALKAAIVALIFMHLKYGGKFIVVVFVSSVFFAVVLVGFVLFDSTEYQQDIRDRAAVGADGARHEAPGAD